jgi:3-hydroxybutyryl-CoA dehydrogenase
MSVPANVGVYGGGRMGSGIAHAFLLAGSSVVIVEADEASADAAREKVKTSLVNAAARGLVGSVDEFAAHLTVVTDAHGLAHTDLVVEAVPEILELKQSVLRRIESAAPRARLASNTSSLSVDVLARALDRPQNLLGLHFFNPVPASQLVEIVAGAKTDPALVAAAQQWVSALGKTAITVTDSPGFASSRLGVALALEAMRMLEEGVASAEDIDTAMTLGYKHPMGPLRTTDVVGLDVRLAIAEHLFDEIGPSFEPPAILRQKVAAGQLGRKTNEGFFAWHEGSSK